jgi:hypothetical protein
MLFDDLAGSSLYSTTVSAVAYKALLAGTSHVKGRLLLPELER